MRVYMVRVLYAYVAELKRPAGPSMRPSHWATFAFNINRLTNGINRLINGIQRLNDSINRFIDGISRFIIH